MKDKIKSKPKVIEINLKTPFKESHNGASIDERIIALVKLMARQTAERDFRKLNKKRHSPKSKKGGK
ncbi:hypothetical protein [Aliikangiella sp. IMCC44359]|uniref:hypothetical protein n=1 Tax=Aliikangiella sp. IMCC44359 TaxID=3459125 RepID=UPI00403B0796